MKINIVLSVTAIFLCGCSSSAPPPTTPASQPTSGEIRRGVEMGGAREERSRRFYEGIARKVEPNLKGSRDRVPQYIEFFKHEFVEDKRTFAFDVKATSERGRTILSGYAEFPEHKAALAEFLKVLKISNVEDKIELLPAEGLGEKKFGFIAVDRCFTVDRAEGKGETFTECLKGEPVFLLRDAGTGRVLCHVSDGYVGYVDSASIERVDGAAFAKRVASGDSNPWLEKAVFAGMQLIGTKYVWGGKSKEGIDCSGLVFNAFDAIGINTPRDADQQALMGRLVAMRWQRGGLRRGDILFFLGRRGTISHTAIYLGDDKFLEATEPVVKISSLNKKHPEYSEKRDKSFCFAKRFLD